MGENFDHDDISKNITEKKEKVNNKIFNLI